MLPYLDNRSASVTILTLQSENNEITGPFARGGCGMLRQALAITLSMLLTTPIWGISNPVGTVASGTGITVAGTSAAAGSTLYDGDTV
jgi:hypothetical protein